MQCSPFCIIMLKNQPTKQQQTGLKHNHLSGGNDYLLKPYTTGYKTLLLFEYTLKYVLKY